MNDTGLMDHQTRSRAMKIILRVGRKGKRNGQASAARRAAEAEVSQLESRVALLGIRLGCKDAIGLARELKEIRPDTLCVTITAYAEFENAI